MSKASKEGGPGTRNFQRSSTADIIHNLLEQPQKTRVSLEYLRATLPASWQLFHWCGKEAQESSAVVENMVSGVILHLHSALYYPQGRGLLFTPLASSSASVKWDSDTHLYQCAHRAHRSQLLRFVEFYHLADITLK